MKPIRSEKPKREPKSVVWVHWCRGVFECLGVDVVCRRCGKTCPVRDVATRETKRGVLGAKRDHERLDGGVGTG